MGSGLCARLWAELRRLWARGCGAPNPLFLVARNCPSNPSNPSNLANGSAILAASTPRTLPMVLPYWPPQTPQAPRTLPMVLPYWPLETLQNLALARLWALGSVRWPLETLQNLALARLWALGSVRDCGRSCADCGLGALARQILFSSGPKLPFKPLKPLNTVTAFHVKRRARGVRPWQIDLKKNTGNLLMGLNSLRTWTMSARYGIPNVFVGVGGTRALAHSIISNHYVIYKMPFHPSWCGQGQEIRD